MTFSLRGVFSKFEKALFNYQDAVDKEVGLAFGKRPSDVGALDRSLFLLAAPLSLAGCTSEDDSPVPDCAKKTYYRDDDGDSFGNANPKNSDSFCEKPEGWVENNLDCDDLNKNKHPYATEECNGVDDNCDGYIDENLKRTIDCGEYNGKGLQKQFCDTGNWVNDGKCIGDGVCKTGGIEEQICGPDIGECEPGKQTKTCVDGQWTNWGDCKDFVGPQTELCDNKDNNCNGLTDEELHVGDTCTVGAGECTSTGKLICSADQSKSVCNVSPKPAGIEVACDGIDQDCNGSDLKGTDADGDGYKAEGGLCGPKDCNDNNKNVYPGKSELELGLANDGIDNNCDGFVDEIVVDGKTYNDPNISATPGYVSIINGGKLTFKKDTAITTDKFLLDSTSFITMLPSVCGKGSGLNGIGNYDGGGGGGGSHLAKGGAGSNGGWAGIGGATGNAYGSLTDSSLESGSCGGKGGSDYGASGGMGAPSLFIKANEMKIHGKVTADGGNAGIASYDDGGGGGASAAKLIFDAVKLFLSSTTVISAKGGNGSNGGSFSASGGGGGGGGAGGIVKIIYRETANLSSDAGITFTTAGVGDFTGKVQSLGIIKLSGGLGGSGGCGSSKCGQSGSSGGDGLLNISVN